VKAGTIGKGGGLRRGLRRRHRHRAGELLPTPAHPTRGGGGGLLAGGADRERRKTSGEQGPLE
jgi:hypothetical protein